MDSTVKVLISTITGNFNNKFSVLYNPDMYYSMTATGQLLMLELRSDLENLLEHILLINTDDAFFVIKKENLKKAWLICDQFEIKFPYKIDTRKDLKSAIVFGSNRYTLIYTNEETETRDLKKKFGFFLGNVYLCCG